MLQSHASVMLGAQMASARPLIHTGLFSGEHACTAGMKQLKLTLMHCHSTFPLDFCCLIVSLTASSPECHHTLAYPPSRVLSVCVQGPQDQIVVRFGKEHDGKLLQGHGIRVAMYGYTYHKKYPCPLQSCTRYITTLYGAKYKDKEATYQAVEKTPALSKSCLLSLRMCKQDSTRGSIEAGPLYILTSILLYSTA
eukprot:1151432-Pelagomonas_calceolata.AAC.7